MECANCEQNRKDFWCSSCIGKELQGHRTALAHLTSERDLLVVGASANLSTLNATRGRRADVASLRSKLDDIQLHTRHLRESNDAARERIAAKRLIISNRRQLLEEAYRLNAGGPVSPPRTPTPTPPGGPPRRRAESPARTTRTREDQTNDRINELTNKLHALQDSLARARQGLVQELVEVFAIVEVGGRPAAGVRAATRGSWSIGGLVLPVPGDMRRVSPAHANAALTFTLHFIGLLTFYLGIRLPFEIGWSGNKLGVGIPEIWATKGEDRGGWARWAIRCPLHLPLSADSAAVKYGSPPSSGPPSPSGSPRPDSNTSATPYPPQPHDRNTSSNKRSSYHSGSHSRRDSLSSSTLSPSLTPSPANASFSTALAMLSYNVAYLAQTQGVDVPLSAAASGALLSTLWAVCCSADLGQRSHDTRPLLSTPTSTLDFRQLLQAQAIATGSVAAGGGRHGRSNVGRGRDLIVEEEDGWEVVDETG